MQYRHAPRYAPVGMGQYGPGGSYNPTGQTSGGWGPFAQPKPLDPLVEVALNTAGQLLKDKDPGAPDTMNLLKDIIRAPGFGFSTSTGTGAGPSIKRLSDLNPALSLVRDVRTHPYIILFTVLSIPILAFLAGRAMGLRAGEKAATRAGAEPEPQPQPEVVFAERTGRR